MFELFEILYRIVFNPKRYEGTPRHPFAPKEFLYVLGWVIVICFLILTQMPEFPR